MTPLSSWQEKVKDLRLIRFPDTGKPKSCFVEMYTAEALEEAVALDGQDLRDRAVSLTRTSSNRVSGRIPLDHTSQPHALNHMHA